ncbi:MAG: glycosyltransferase, partial [Nitrospira sp.]
MTPLSQHDSIQFSLPSAFSRPRVKGKFLVDSEEKLWVRGVTYGTFRPQTDGGDYLDPVGVRSDLGLMSAKGINAIRTYTVPPRWFLDIAYEHRLRVMVGLPWEQHVDFLERSTLAQHIEDRLRAEIHRCAGHPAILCYAIGNEIPSSIVRWHGRRAVERYLERLYKAAKKEDPGGLVTYVNYPTTEYLNLPFLDLVCFNVYLERQDRFQAYLARLQNLAGDRPLIMAEVGMDSRRHGEARQAEVLEWQIRAAYSSGSAGAFVFGWTDEWHRGGQDITDWDFGLTRRDREPKPALSSVSRAFASVPLDLGRSCPSVSVVVCSYNGSRIIRDCLEGLRRLAYPNYEVIVVDDGSTDSTASIAREYECRLIRTENRGLSSARNTGMKEATGEIIAYLDDDAWPDSHWLHYLVNMFETTAHVGVGGPNLPPPGDGLIADCVANAPGGPVHVLLSDEVAEHIPGCNMAFRKSCLEAIGGFDVQFRTAGDDVDVCWRLQDKGWTLGFHPAAMVWHHRRNSVRAYWRQQKGYGKAEALLERKWPEKYQVSGNATWGGRMYGKGLLPALGGRTRIYHGTWGAAPFQSLYQPALGFWQSLPMMPEWYLLILGSAMLSALGVFWHPLLGAAPFLIAAVMVSAVQAVRGGARASFTTPTASHWQRAWMRTLTTGLYLLQPFARLSGRLRCGLTPWRIHAPVGASFPLPRRVKLW